MSTCTVIVVPPYRSFSLVAGIFQETLTSQGMDVRFLVRNYDRCLDEVDISFVRDMLLFEPKVIGFSCFFWNLRQNLRLTELAKVLQPTVFTVLGGPQVSGDEESIELLKAHASVDAVLRGEADLSFPELVKRLSNDEDTEGVAGLVRRHAGGIAAPAVPYTLPDLEKVPLVYHEHNPYLSQYLNDREVMPLQTVRGCSQNCTYCSYGSDNLRIFPLDRTEREIAFLCHKRVRHVRVCDSHFGGSKKRAMMLFEMIRCNNTQTRFYIYPDPLHIDDDYLKKAEKANCQVISLGIQTLDEEIAEHINRRLPNQKWWQAFDLLREQEQTPQLDMMFGLPYQTVDSVCSDLVRLRQKQISRVLFSPLMLFPGTSLAQKEFKRHLEILDTPQRFAHSATLSRMEYASMVVLTDAYQILSRFHRTTWFLDTQYKERSEQTLTQWFHSVAREHRNELLALGEILRASAAYIRNTISELTMRLLSLFAGLFTEDELSLKQISELVRMDTLEIAMQRRNLELSRGVYLRNRSQAVILSDEILAWHWILDDESWFETHDVSYKLALKGEPSPSGFPANNVCCIYHCPTAAIHFADAIDASLLKRFYRAAPLFDDDNIFSSQTLERFAKWIRLGVLEHRSA